MNKGSKSKKKLAKSHLKSLRIYLKSRKCIFVDNLLGGIAWGVGSVIGATIIIGILSVVFVKMRRIPLLGEFAEKFAAQMEEARDETKDVLNGE